MKLSPRPFTQAQTMSSKKDLSLALMVDKKANRVLWAESGGDVVDVLLSFLTLPLGTAVRVLGKQSGLGCVDELYKSVEALDESYFQTPCCKNMLLRPRSAAERLCQDLPAKVDDSDLAFYTCSNKSCIEKNYCSSVFSSVKGTCCRCLGTTDRIMKWGGGKSSAEAAINGVFIDRGGRFSISDDLCISPLSASTTISLLQRCGLEEGQLEHMEVELSRERVLKLLQKSLTSKTALTEVFLRTSGCQPNELLLPITTREELVKAGCGKEFKARLIKSRARNEVMYAELGEDTVNLLFSFLAIPLGSIVRLLGKASHIGCVDNLYWSVETLCAAKYSAKLEKHRDMLLAPKIATHFGCSNKLLDVDEIKFETTMNKCAGDHCATIPAPVCTTHGKVAQAAVQINPKLGNGSTEKGGNFAKGKPGTFMVTDDMMVTTNSSISGLQMMNKRNFHVRDMEFGEVVIGKKEALALLRGLLLTGKSLTHVFCQTKSKGSEDRCIKTEEDA